MQRHVVFALGADRPGIVAGVTGAVLDADGNLDDCSMTILSGHFAIVLVVSTPDVLDADALARRLDEVAERLELSVVVRPIAEAHPEPTGGSHVVSVYGADRPGIVHRVTSVLADAGVNVTDLETRRVGAEAAPLYAMLLEVALPADLDPDALRARLDDVAVALDVEVSVHPVDADVL